VLVTRVKSVKASSGVWFAKATGKHAATAMARVVLSVKIVEKLIQEINNSTSPSATAKLYISRVSTVCTICFGFN
jgi:hypothetical protein